MKNVRICFEKGEEIKFISHLDILRTFHRILRRSGLLIAYSEGFNPHPQTSFALPLPVGATGESEYADLKLIKDYEPNEVLELINGAAPQGFKVKEVGEPLLPFADIKRAEYEIDILVKNGEKDFEIIKNLLRKEEIFVTKKSKKGLKDVDIAPMIHTYDISLEKDNSIKLLICTSAGSKENLSPNLIITACQNSGAEIIYSKINRKALFCDKKGDLLKSV